MLRVIYVYIYICTRVHLYIAMVCTDHMTIGMCLCVLLAANGMVCYWFTVYCLWCVFMWILYSWIYLCHCLMDYFITNSSFL